MHKIIVLSMSQVTIFVYLRSTFKLTLNLIIDKIFFQVEKNLVAAFLTGTGKFQWAVLLKKRESDTGGGESC